MKFSDELKDACKAHPTSKEVHVNEEGAWLFGDAKGIHASFGKFETVSIDTVLGVQEEGKKESSKKK